MPQFAIVYIGGNHPSSPEEGQKHFARYMEWLSALGEAVISPANPFSNTHTVQPDRKVIEGGDSKMSGYTIVEADSMESALKMAKSCPFLEIEGSLEVSEIMQMPE